MNTLRFAARRPYTTSSSLSVVVAMLCALPVVLHAQQTRAVEPTIAPLMEISGSDSRITDRSTRLIGNADEWRQLWQKHTGKENSKDTIQEGMPRLNFDRCIVVAIFQGKQHSNLGVVAKSVEERPEAIVLRVENRWFGSRTRLGDPPPQKMTPYGFIVLPRTTKEILLEEAVASSKQYPQTFEERSRFRP
jgi:hypothetical protein